MKDFVKTIVIASTLVAPIVAFAQTATPVTRAQLQAELRALHSVGYDPASVSNNYPADIQAAEAKLADQRASTSMGSDVGGSSASGYRAPVSRLKSDSTYSH